MSVSSPEVFSAEYAGACFGVSRALDLTLKTAESAEGRVFTLGPLIHNPLVTQELAKKGIRALDENDIEHLLPTDTVILRTHGITKALYTRISKRTTHIVDATCPFVKNVHTEAQAFEAQGYEVVIAGEPKHPETLGIQGQVQKAFIVEDANDLSSDLIGKKVGIVAQTTQTHEMLNSIVSAVKVHASEVVVKDTICDATKKRQEATEKLAQEVDCMLIIGGKNSANTTRLYEIASRYTLACYIENPEEISAKDFAKFAKIGISAGASTPVAHIKRVRDILKNSSKNTT